MEQLSFGEQLKVILNRRKMTIKALAELIEEHTGKKMSRQNLTQRLGRDNFQEQDMRMIAEILGCPFTLNILTVEEGLEVEKEEPVIQDEGVKEKKVIVAKPLMGQEELAKEPTELEQEEPTKEEVEKFDSPQDSPEELAEALEEETDEMDDEEDWDDLGEPIEDEHFITVGDLRDMNQELSDLEKEANFRAKGIFLRVKGVDADQEQIEKERKEQRAGRTGLSQDTQEIIKREDLRAEESKAEEEQVPQGEINPYTGKEYETNSVRTHPTRIGYVQVYDRGIHRWKDMTEWAFLGYQERKKAILGSRYEEPIYLD